MRSLRTLLLILLILTLPALLGTQPKKGGGGGHGDGTDCVGGQFAIGVDSQGNANCADPPGAGSGDDITVDSAFTDPANPLFKDTASINVTATDLGVDEITYDVIPGGVDHDSLQNSSAAEHVDWALASQGTIHVTNMDGTLLVESDVGPGLEFAGTLHTQSDEAGFIIDLGAGALTCGGSNEGKMAVNDTSPLAYCDGTATPTLRYAATGSSSGEALAIDDDLIVDADVNTAANIAGTKVSLAGVSSRGTIQVADQTAVDLGTDTQKAIVPKTLNDRALSGGELGGTIGSPTVNTDHSGSAHHTIFSPDANIAVDYPNVTTGFAESVEDLYGAATTLNTETRITVTYDDTDGTVDYIVDDMNDDVPEAGDFGAAAALNGTDGDLVADIVGLDELFACVAVGQSHVEYDNAGVPTCQEAPRINVTTPQDGQLLRYNAAGTNWTNGAIALGDTDAVSGILPGANVQSAGTSNEGVSQLAITSEVSTGTDTSKVITPDALNLANLNPTDIDIEGETTYSTKGTFGAADTTPLVDGKTMWHTGGAVTITDFDKTGNPVEGDEIVVIAHHNVSFDCSRSGAFFFCGGSFLGDVYMRDGDVTGWTYEGTHGAGGYWRLMYRSTIAEEVISITIPTPATTDDAILLYCNAGVQCEMSVFTCIATGATTANLNVKIEDCTVAGSCGDTGADHTVTTNNSGYFDSGGTLTDPILQAGRIWKINLVTVTTAPEQLFCQVEYWLN